MVKAGDGGAYCAKALGHSLQMFFTTYADWIDRDETKIHEKSGRRCAEHLKYGPSMYFSKNFLIRGIVNQSTGLVIAMQHLFTPLLLGFSLTALPAFAITAQEFAALCAESKGLNRRTNSY